ncbi:nucleotidase [Oceanobacillus picturae]|uniref:Nucleotidase n=1 Tax=Oceanobacillus picturae TaxID=171693 RepID=A0A0U9H9U5_9BACI|nr:HAD family acid phosphatase [Oceanobacillus picturae]GAQ16470.1 nucleotidase [Oceanobacillus picturae]
MKFGFDIDDTLINLRAHAFHIYNKKLGKQIPLEAFHALKQVEIHEPFGLNDKEGKAMWEQSLESIYYTDCPAFPGAVEVLNELKGKGHTIYYITARPMVHGERTKAWMKEKGFPVEDDAFFYGMNDHEKINIIQNLELDYYVDDKPAVLSTLQEEPTTLVIKDQSYNREFTQAIRLYEWKEFISLIESRHP